MSEAEDLGVVMTRPTTNGEAPLARRGGPKGLLPSTWIGRTIRASYRDAGGRPQETSGVLADLYPSGPILTIGATRTCILWDSLVVIELEAD